jgi:hypothetical protein
MTILSGRLAGLAAALFALTLAFDSAVAAPASAFGREVQVREARDGYVGTLDVVPVHGKIGERFTVKAQDLPPNQEFQLVWVTVNGRWKVTESEYKGREFIPVAYEMGKLRSDAQGRLTATFTTPEDFGFGHDILLQQGDRLMTQVAYSIDMTIDISPKSGPLGTPITVDVKGIGYVQLMGAALRQRFHRLVLGGDDARIGEVHDPRDRPCRRSHSRSAAWGVHLPLPQHAAESRA